MQNHRHVDRRDLLVAVRVREGHSPEVRVLVLEVFSRQAHHGLALVLAGCRRFFAFLQPEVRFRIQITADAVYRVSGHSVIPAIVRQRARVTVQNHRHVDRRDGQLTSNRVRNGIVFSYILFTALDVDRSESTIIIRRSRCICTLRRGIGNSQHIAIAEAGNGVFIRGNSFAGTGDRTGDGIACLILSVIRNGLVVYGYGQGGRIHGQGAQVFRNRIVAGLHIAPGNSVFVIYRTWVGDGTGGGDGHFALIRFNQAGEGSLLIGQRCAIVRLAVAAGGDGQFLRYDFQKAGTDIQAYAVVAVFIRHIGTCQGKIIGVNTHIFFILNIIAKACFGASFHITQCDNCIPDVIAIFCCILAIADHHVIRNSLLVRIGEADKVIFALIRSVGPAVRLHAHGNIDLVYRQGAADIADGVVTLHASMFTADSRIARGDSSGTSVHTAIARLIIRTGIGVANGIQRIATQQAFHLYLIGQSSRQGEGCTVIFLGLVDHGDGGLLLIEEGEHQAIFTFSDLFRNLVTAASACAVIRNSFNGLVQLPACNGGTAEGEGFADFEDLDIIRSNGLTIHIHEVNSDLGILIGRIVERKDVLRRIRRQDQGLFHGIGEELHAFQLRIRRIERIIIHRSCQFDDRNGITGNIVLDLLSRNRRARAGFAVGDHILNGIGRLFSFFAVDKGDDIFCVVARQRQGLGALIGTIAHNADGGFLNHIADIEVGIDDLFVRRHRIMLIRVIHILDGVAQRSRGPVGIHSGIGRDLGVPVKQLISIRAVKPAVKHITRLGGVALRRGGLFIFFYSLRINRGTTVGVEAHGKGGRSPLRIQHQVAGRHGGEGIR